MSAAIAVIRAYEILDSRGTPTVSAQVELSNGVTSQAQVPSGASTGRHEAAELRDGDPARFFGRGVQKAVAHIEGILSPALRGMPIEDPESIDRRMMEIDGSENKSRLGANAILGVSCAVARALSVTRGEPLWTTLATFNADGTLPSLPLPMINIVSGGLHAGRNIEFQDFLVAAHGFQTYSAALEASVKVHTAAKVVLGHLGAVLTGVADEGGWGPALDSNQQALSVVTNAIEKAGYEPGRQVSIAIDVASSHFFSDGVYRMTTERRVLSRREMIDVLEQWVNRYPIYSIEDGLHEDDWAGWQELTRRLGHRVQLVGDDFFTTNPSRLERGVRERAGNAVLVKMNQIGTLSETFRVLRIARASGFRAVVSARSGETEDSFLADLAVASGAGQIKVGSVTRSERLAKYNRLLEIEKTARLPFDRSAIRAN